MIFTIFHFQFNQIIFTHLHQIDVECLTEWFGVCRMWKWGVKRWCTCMMLSGSFDVSMFIEYYRLHTSLPWLGYDENGHIWMEWCENESLDELGNEPLSGFFSGSRGDREDLIVALDRELSALPFLRSPLEPVIRTYCTPVLRGKPRCTGVSKRVWHFARKRPGYRPTFFFAKWVWGGISKVPSFPLFPSSAIFPFSPFLPPHLDITRMTWLLSQGVPIDSTGVAGAFLPGGSHLFTPVPSLSIRGIAMGSLPSPSHQGHHLGHHTNTTGIGQGEPFPWQHPWEKSSRHHSSCPLGILP